MPEAEFALIVFAGSVLAGLVGALTGLGGGVVIVPLLTFAFHVDFRYAAGASIISVIATSSAAASTYVKEGYTNLRIGMFLEIATTLGAVGGALLATYLKVTWLSALFGLVLLYSAFSAGGTHTSEGQSPRTSSRLAKRLRLPGRYPGAHGVELSYGVQRVPLGFSLMALAGALSGLLGIGSGAFKVLAMDRAMGIPFKVSTTTSNFMIGVTAAASAGVYFAKGFVNPLIAGPVMLGVLAGATFGTHFLIQWRTPVLRRIFSVVLVALGGLMLWNSFHPVH
jgi:uncharacterized membrane protein YfcA